MIHRHDPARATTCSSLCVRTNEDRIALITITKVLPYKGYNAETVVWEP